MEEGRREERRKEIGGVFEVGGEREEEREKTRGGVCW